MYYNIKIKSNGCEFCLESSDIKIAQREMDVYFANMFCASEEFKSHIKKIQVTDEKVKSIDEIEKLSSNDNQQLNDNQDIKINSEDKDIKKTNEVLNQNNPQKTEMPEVSTSQISEDTVIQKEDSAAIQEDDTAVNQEADLNNFDPILGSSIQEVIDTIKINASSDSKNKNETRSVVLGADIFESQKPEMILRDDTAVKNEIPKEDSKAEVLKFAAKQNDIRVQPFVQNEAKQPEVIQIKNAQDLKKHASEEIVFSTNLNNAHNFTDEIVSIHTDLKAEIENKQAGPELLDIKNNNNDINYEDIVRTPQMPYSEKISETPVSISEKQNQKNDLSQNIIELYQPPVHQEENSSSDIFSDDEKLSISQTKQQMAQNNIQQIRDAVNNNSDVAQNAFNDFSFSQNEPLPTVADKSNEEEILRYEDAYDSKNDPDDNIDDLINLMQSEIDSLDITSQETESKIESSNNIQNQNIISDTGVSSIEQQNNKPQESVDINQQGPQLDFKLFLAGFLCSELIDEFLICAYYIKHILRQDGFTMKFINSKLFQATGHIADMSVVDELCSKNYLKVLATQEGNKYCITANGEEYFAKKFQG